MEIEKIFINTFGKKPKFDMNSDDPSVFDTDVNFAIKYLSVTKIKSEQILAQWNKSIFIRHRRGIMLTDNSITSDSLFLCH